ncbi:hypothetical protein DYQ86_15690 [Acidobacteria bacterium AB60]|nr:hypothetical protein DYQ86_15690 [Acidobacteria bacterium AB60]
MAAAHVLHVGDRSYHRSEVLRGVGYAVTECDTPEEMATWFRLGHLADVVCISEWRGRECDEEIALARLYSVAPVVLFRASDRAYLKRGCDLEFPPFVHPAEWLHDLERLLGR